MMDKKSLIYFSLIIIAAGYIVWHFKRKPVIAAVIPANENPVDAASESTMGIDSKVNTVAPAEQTYNAPSNIWASDPATQDYLTKSQAQLILSPSVFSQLQNARSTGLPE
jgi:hypothetical protein